MCHPCVCACICLLSKLVSAQNLLQDIIDSIHIWYLDIQYQNTGQVRFGLQSTNFEGVTGFLFFNKTFKSNNF